MLRDVGVIHMFAPYSLVRSALENACAAVWMLQPKSRAERVARRLRFAAANIENSEKAKRLIGTVGPHSKQELISELRDIGRQAGIDEADAVRRVGYGEIVQAVSSTLGLGPVIPVSWSLCSGIAHGDFWTTLSAAERVELPGAPPGLGSFKITANVQLLMYVTTFATQMTGHGWRLYDQRSRPPY